MQLIFSKFMLGYVFFTISFDQSHLSNFAVQTRYQVDQQLGGKFIHLLKIRTKLINWAPEQNLRGSPTIPSISYQSAFEYVQQPNHHFNGSIKLLPERVDWIGLKSTQEGEDDSLTLLGQSNLRINLIAKYNLEKHL
ncbi:hypothetical protein NC651_027976 [Populus alba x Populus x berolinensis]|nr:hypothetical protein NC651_027976 [Populus alba x Populus x berolinensis]